MHSVLVVDDDPDIRSLAALVLARSGFSVTEAGGGVEALAALRGVRPDVVLLDVQMPFMDGWDTLEAIRGNPATVGLPVVLFTVKTRLEDRLRGWQLGCDGYIAKPFDTRWLEAEIKRVVSQSKEQRDGARRAGLDNARRELASTVEA